jgi:hypothetical protein
LLPHDTNPLGPGRFYLATDDPNALPRNVVFESAAFDDAGCP